MFDTLTKQCYPFLSKSAALPENGSMEWIDNGVGIKYKPSFAVNSETETL
jgi:hypothetical protein